MAAWVYILKCRDGSYYTGCTTNLDQRIGQHQAGTTGGYTSTRLPVEVAWCGEFQDLHDAIDYERKLKRWSRAKKEAVINGEWDRLPGLARNRQYHPAPEWPSPNLVILSSPRSGRVEGRTAALRGSTRGALRRRSP